MAPEPIKNPMNAVKFVSVFRSPKEQGLYLYLAHHKSEEQAFEPVPEELRQQFGQPVLALSLELKADRKLARANAQDVLNAIEEKGYYLQLPPNDFLNK